MSENLTSRDPDTGMLTIRNADQRLTRLEFYTELMTAWVYQKQVADSKSYMAVFKDVSQTLAQAIKALENSYTKQELYGVGAKSELFYKKEIDAIHIDRSTDCTRTVDRDAVQDSTGYSGRENEDTVSH